MTDSLPIILLFGTLILTLSFAAGKRSRAASESGRISWLGSYASAYQRCLDVLPELGASITAADPDKGTISARAGVVRGFAVEVRVLVQTQEGVTFVNIGASSLLAPRPARRFVNEFLQYWDRLPNPVVDS